LRGDSAISLDPHAKNKTMARPTKPTGTKRILRVDIRLTPDEQMHLFAKATEQGLTVSDLVRWTIINTKPLMKRADPDRAALIRALGELGKVGSNVNQIAHELHRERIAGNGRAVPDNAITSALAGVQNLSDSLLKLLTGDR